MSPKHEALNHSSMKPVAFINPSAARLVKGLLNVITGLLGLCIRAHATMSIANPKISPASTKPSSAKAVPNTWRKVACHRARLIETGASCKTPNEMLEHRERQQVCQV